MPIEINSYEDLKKIGVEEDYPLDGDYVLTQDIECNPEDPMDPIVGFETMTLFTGFFDGQGYVIRNLKVKEFEGSLIFMMCDGGATVKNIIFEDLILDGEEHEIDDVQVVLFRATGENHDNKNIQFENIILTGENSIMRSKGDGYCYGFFSSFRLGDNILSIKNCHVHIDVVSSVHCAGMGEGTAIFEDCSVTGKVTGGGSGRVGGFLAQGNSTVKRCKVTGDVEAGSSSDIGGFVGRATSDAVFEDCYAINNVTAEEGTNPGGFVGNSNDNIKRCYSVGEVKAGSEDGYAFAGSPSGNEQDCFYDKDILNNEPEESGAEGKTTAEMQSIATFSEWDIAEYENYEDETWFIVDEEDYPRLSWEYEGYEPPEVGVVGGYGGIRVGYRGLFGY